MKRMWPPVALLAAAAVVWELVVRAANVPDYLFPAPTAVASSLADDAGLLSRATLVTLREMVLGYLLAVAVAVAIAVLAPAGVGLGMAMPIGLRRLAALYPGGVAWAWAINGFTSVLASVLALLVAISWGFEATTLLALGCYLVALAHAVTGRWPPHTAAANAGAAGG